MIVQLTKNHDAETVTIHYLQHPPTIWEVMKCLEHEMNYHGGVMAIDHSRPRGLWETGIIIYALDDTELLGADWYAHE